MPRERRIKPSLFKNEVLGTADPLYTVLFEGLWIHADRDGRLEDRPLRLKVEIFPYRDVNFDEALQWLHDNGFIIRYTVAGQRYIQIVNFTKYQKVHPNETPSTIPEYKEVTEISTIGASPSTIGVSTQTLNSYSFPSSSFESLMDDSRVNPLPPDNDFQIALDGIRSDLKLLQLPKESEWVEMLERAFTNKFSPAHVIECHRLLRRQKWRNSAVTPKILEENLTELEKLRETDLEKNGNSDPKHNPNSSQELATRLGTNTRFL